MVEDKIGMNDKVISLKSQENSTLIKVALEQNKEQKMLFLSHKESSFVTNSFKEINDNNQKLSYSYPYIRFIFLKDSWSILDASYGKTFFINEVQKMMKEEDFDTLYLHRGDTFFEGSTKRDIQRVISDIIEISRYYHKRVIFSFNEKTALGKIIDDVVSVEVDLELEAFKDSDGVYKSRIIRCKKEHTNIVLFSDKKEVLDFHKYIFKKDPNINFLYIEKLDVNSKTVLANSDIIIFNLDNIDLKDQLLRFIDKQRLKTKFLFLSDEKVIRKRDKIRKLEKGIFQVYEKYFDLLEYIHTIEKIIGRNFYSEVLKQVNIVPTNKYFKQIEEFENVVYNFRNYHIYFSIVAIKYEDESAVDKELVESCIRELDMVYHDEINKKLLFLLVDIFPSNGFSLVSERLREQKVSIVKKEAFCADEFIHLMGKKIEYV